MTKFGKAFNAARDAKKAANLASFTFGIGSPESVAAKAEHARKLAELKAVVIAEEVFCPFGWEAVI